MPVIWFLSLVSGRAPDCTLRHILLHLKQATLSPCASVSSHLLSWHWAHTCRLTTSSHCTLLLAKPTAHPHRHDRPGIFIGSSGVEWPDGEVRTGCMVIQPPGSFMKWSDLDETFIKFLTPCWHRGGAKMKTSQASQLRLAPTAAKVSPMGKKDVAKPALPIFQYTCIPTSR